LKSSKFKDFQHLWVMLSPTGEPSSEESHELSDLAFETVQRIGRALAIARLVAEGFDDDALDIHYCLETIIDILEPALHHAPDLGESIDAERTIEERRPAMSEPTPHTCPSTVALDAIAKDLDDSVDGVPGLLQQALVINAFVAGPSGDGFCSSWSILDLEGGKQADEVLRNDGIGVLFAIMKV
jgi:hypothetical protein